MLEKKSYSTDWVTWNTKQTFRSSSKTYTTILVLQRPTMTSPKMCIMTHN